MKKDNIPRLINEQI